MTSSHSYGAIKPDESSSTDSVEKEQRNQDDDVSTKERSIAVGLATLSGVLGILQTGVNTSLCRMFFPNPVAATGVSYVFGLATMVLISLAEGADLPGGEQFRNVPRYAFIGGLLGGSYKTTAIILAPKVGFATFHIAAVAGQVCCDV